MSDPNVALDEAQLTRALAQVPPGRNLAGEFLRLRSYLTELQRQVVRGTELRIAAEQRAGKRNVGKLEDELALATSAIGVLAEALKSAPWKSGRCLSEAVQGAIVEREASPDVRPFLEELLGIGLEPSRLQEGTIVYVTTEGEPMPRLGKIVAIHPDQFHMFDVEILATRQREDFAACFLEPA